MLAAQGNRGQATMNTAPAAAGAGEASLERSEGAENVSLLPPAIEVTSKGLQQGNPGVAGGGGGLGGGGVGGGGGVEEVAYKRAIADVFRKLDLDSSGHVAEEELLEGVSACFVSLNTAFPGPTS